MRWYAYAPASAPAPTIQAKNVAARAAPRCKVHFMNPVPPSAMVEVVRGARTSEATRVERGLLVTFLDEAFALTVDDEDLELANSRSVEGMLRLASRQRPS
jgi:3-hydroxyacyl-CoA dehydrogenase, NAD binding domain